MTGSDGKTTTTTIIAELLKAAGNTVHVGGNIGNPLLCRRPTTMQAHGTMRCWSCPASS
ncbi:MAG: Mur ligase family protein [Oscillospiraceae bacterium]